MLVRLSKPRQTVHHYGISLFGLDDSFKGKICLRGVDNISLGRLNHLFGIAHKCFRKLSDGVSRFGTPKFLNKSFARNSAQPGSKVWYGCFFRFWTCNINKQAFSHPSGSFYHFHPVFDSVKIIQRIDQIYAGLSVKLINVIDQKNAQGSEHNCGDLRFFDNPRNVFPMTFLERNKQQSIRPGLLKFIDESHDAGCIVKRLAVYRYAHAELLFDFFDLFDILLLAAFSIKG
jgi:hypothetical protein